jgi:hypothetical protein
MPLLVHVTGLHILQFQEAVIGVKTKHKLGVNLTHKICHVILTNAIRLVFVFILNQTRAIIDIIGILNKVKVLLILTLFQILLYFNSPQLSISHLYLQFPAGFFFNFLNFHMIK